MQTMAVFGDLLMFDRGNSSVFNLMVHVCSVSCKLTPRSERGEACYGCRKYFNFEGESVTIIWLDHNGPTLDEV
jgi:hypothetical protein